MHKASYREEFPWAERNSTDSGAEGSFGSGTLRKHCTGVPASSPLTDKRSITEVVPRFFALCAERLSVQRAFLICDEYCSLRQFYYGKNIDESGSDRILPDEKEDNRKHE